MIGRAHRLYNCWLAAMWFWWYARAKHPVAIRRSRHWWFVPHFVATLPSRWRHFHAVEYVPPRKRRWTTQDFVVLFRGRYRVTEYRAVGVQWFDSREDVLAWKAWREGTHFPRMHEFEKTGLLQLLVAGLIAVVAGITAVFSA